VTKVWICELALLLSPAQIGSEAPKVVIKLGTRSEDKVYAGQKAVDTVEEENYFHFMGSDQSTMYNVNRWAFDI
jgi:hypothetical protein